MLVPVTVVLYFSLLLLIAHFTGTGGNDAFFRGRRQSPWFLVAFGMIGTTLSGVTFVSVPGMVLSSGMGYMQMCFGYFFGYLAIAFVLLPIYYRLRLTSIYTYLDTRFGRHSYKTGAAFFLLSKLTGAAARLFLVCTILQAYVFDDLGVPFLATELTAILLIWLYTRRSGIQTLVWTDTLQTFCFVVILALLIWKVLALMDMDLPGALRAIWNDPHSQVLDFSDWTSRNYFWKQFISGIFIVIVMTGLDQDMMQKNLTCRTLRDAQKDLCVSGLLIVVVIGLVMSLGVLITLFYGHASMALPAGGDSLIPQIIQSGALGPVVLVLFTVGIIASAFSSADSAMTALTTSFCIDILEIENPERCVSTLRDVSPEKVRKRTHLGMMLLFGLLIFGFRAVGSTSVIDTLLTLVSYTYGPLLGLYTFGIFTRRQPQEKWVPLIAVASPLLCLALDALARHQWGYAFGYELLVLNGALTFLGLFLASSRRAAK